jgi:hypothetical protein
VYQPVTRRPAIPARTLRLPRTKKNETEKDRAVSVPFGLDLPVTD